MTPDQTEGLVAAVRARGGFAIVDEIYQGLYYGENDGDRATSALSFGDDVITVNSFSKYFSMTGWRLGWLVLPEALVPAVEKLAQNLFICAPAIAQHAALAAFHDDAIAIFEERRQEFRRRRDFLVPALRDLGFQVPVLPDGAFYVYADITQVPHRDAHDSSAFGMAVLRDALVAIVPGDDFGFAAPKQHVRFSYATKYERIEQAVDRLARLLRR
jgi:aspartate/methionine/tyrosine aminotransferase